MTKPANGPATPVVFPCEGETLVGMLHRVEPGTRLGVIVIVGGPQYRVGSHRQFVELARTLAAAGIPVLRFDFRGMGDSGGTFRGIDNIEPEIHASIDALCDANTRIERVVLWGLCDAAAAILLHAHTDPRVAGVVLLNPWVRTDVTFARTQLRHYYLIRLADREFWRRLLAGQVRIGEALSGAFAAVRAAFARLKAGEPNPREAAIPRDLPLPDRMALGLSRFHGPALLILSGNDLTAREFEGAVAASDLWRRLLAGPRILRRDLPGADHTFSNHAWSRTVAEWTREWVSRL